ncbi:hypothetical protein Csp2054_14130 [Curtobacterium sp. 'Ferrero']|uniref:hypothetical protein n=1 Tax=Curtobacterium sp. 'Ferrero' TaxID=2033654 RepID=UPI000BDC3A53|nr:hypothetical protein [Curtobacterium sp. 'Ferrero']PCN46977.1 hypothetical protein Csp2054_14130 [Curtobacterium sp. 'Ferrero']
MSTAARKERKRIRRRWGYESAEATQSYPIAGPYQHPRREGIPYGRSKPWSIDRDIAQMHHDLDVTRAIVEFAPDLWRRAVSR